MNFRFLFGESVINLPGAALNYIQKASASELRVLIAAAGGKYASFDELAAVLPRARRKPRFLSGAARVCSKAAKAKRREIPRLYPPERR